MTFVPKNPNDAIVGQNVKHIRTGIGMTQTELANLLGITFQQVQKYEKGFNRIGAGRLLDIANHLGCAIMDLYQGTGAKSKRSATLTPYRSTRQGVELCKAVGGIPNKATRRKFVELAKTLSFQ